MTTLPTAARILWLGTAATIPGGFSRDTDFDGKFIQIMDKTFTVSTTGGGSHNHEIAAHTHTGYPHAHVISSSNVITGTSALVNRTAFPPGFSVPGQAHSHANNDSAVATPTYQNSSAYDFSTETTQPSHFTVIVLKPNDGNQQIPNGATIFVDDIAPTGFGVHNGIQAFPNLQNYFLKGAGTGADGGGTGGADVHSHTNTGHGHTANSHTHSASLCGAASAITVTNASPSVSVIHLQHHNNSLSSKVGPNADSNTDASSEETNYPSYKKLLAIKNTSGSSLFPWGIIVLYVGDVSSGAPTDWRLANVANRQIRCTSQTDEIGDTGGENNHTHTYSHFHTTTGTHNHTAQTTGTGSSKNYDSGFSNCRNNSNHTHTWTVSSVVSGGVQTTSPTIETVDKRAAYRTCVLIKYAPERVLIKGNTTILGNTVIK